MPAYKRSSSDYLLVSVSADGQHLVAMTIDTAILRKLIEELEKLGLRVEEEGTSLCG